MFDIRTAERDGQWVATAVRVASGERFGVECVGATVSEATRRMRAWLEWQVDHSAALDHLQQAERDYHRAIAGSAFTSPAEAIGPVELQKESLGVLEAARARLDEVRSRRP